MTYMHDTMKKRQDEALTWLARNVHEWPATIIDTKRQDNLFWIEPEKNNIKAVINSSQFNVFTKEQWLTRRAELQNKPGWDDVPSDIEYMAQETNGAWGCWYDKPKPDEDINNNGDAVWYWAGNRPAKDFNIANEQVGEVLGDWRDTLERRPQAAKPEPVTEPSSDDWHKRGELPPAGEICVLHAKENNGEKVMFIGITSDSFPVFETFEKRVFVERGEYRFTPLQTERERAASELVDVMMAVPVSDRKTASESYMSMALAIYDHLHKESKS